MKTTHPLMLLLLTVLLTASACTPSKKNRDRNHEPAVTEAPAASDASAEQVSAASATDADIIAFLTNMYATRQFESTAFLQAHCSARLLRELAEEYADEYDACDDCYATWEFRSDAQDAKPGHEDAIEVVEIKPMRGGWFRCTLSDGGWKCINKIKVSKKDGKLIIDDLEDTYSEYDD